MQSLWLENQSLSLHDIPKPNKASEALIKVRLSAICGTVQDLVRGYYPYTGVLGHEFVGEVVGLPDA
jgi:threonine dehydrogenase-like Zn-dependent dehydrogenase